MCVVKDPMIIKTPEAKFGACTKLFGKRSIWILAQGAEDWEQIEHSSPYLGRDRYASHFSCRIAEHASREIGSQDVAL